MFAPPFLEITKFIPHSYESLRPSDQNKYSQEKYQSYVTWYDKLHDSEWKRIWYDSDGLKVTGFLGLPKPLVPNKKYPVIIYCRGGSNDDGKITVEILHNFLAPWVQAGYIVAAPQYRGNDGGQGRDELAGADVDDVVNLYHLLKQIACVDSNNMFMVGNSRGVMMAAAAVKNGVDVKALVLKSGVSDLIAFEEERPDSKELLRGMIKCTPETERQEYERRSPLYWTNAITMPTLFLHGDADTIVDISHSKKIIAALEKQKTPYEFVIYPGGDHSLINDAHDVNKQIVDWFEKYKKKVTI